jgi:hypothetical protein
MKANRCFAICSLEKRSSAIRRAHVPILPRKTGSLIKAATDRAMAEGSPGGRTKNPDNPSDTASGTPPTAEATPGNPQPIASMIARGMPSGSVLGKTRISLAQ